MFHVVTHAFFKACLFLGAGSVIHALSGEQDIRKMGGLLRKIPITGWTFLVAWLAIAGIAPFAGFFSKDEILWQAFSRPNEILPWLPRVLWAVGFVTAGITALYMTRLIGLVFLGKSRVSEEAAHHLHESPLSMTAPLVILAAGSLLIGFLGVPEFIAHGGDRFGAWLSPSLASTGGEIAHETGGAGLEWGLMLASLGIAIAGIAGGLFLYVRAPELPGRIAARFGPIYRTLVNKYWVDEIYQAAVVRPIREGSRMVLWKGVDVRVIDGVVNGVGFMSRMGSSLVRVAQTGAVQLYAAAVLVGVVFLLWVMR
jgi:NADH-quinone oxidoreductase subunit L